MRIETTRIVADWLLHATQGVNAYVLSVPRDAGDPAPPMIAGWADPVNTQVQPLAVFDDTRHPWVIRRNDPPAMPCLWVATVGTVDVTGEPWPNGDYRTTETAIQVAIGYVTAEEDAFKAVRDGDYTLRAVARSMRALMLNANDSSRLRNGVHLISMVPPLRYAPMGEAVGASRMSGGLLINIEGEDSTPSY